MKRQAEEGRHENKLYAPNTQIKVGLKISYKLFPLCNQCTFQDMFLLKKNFPGKGDKKIAPLKTEIRPSIDGVFSDGRVFASASAGLYQSITVDTLFYI